MELTADGPDGQPKTPVAGNLDGAGADGKVRSAYARIPKDWVAGAYFCTLSVWKTDGNGQVADG